MSEMNDPEMEWVKQMTEATGKAQALALANQFILFELVRVIGRHTEDPQKLFASMFGNIMARLDQQPLEKQGHPVSAEMRYSIETFFARASQGFDVR